MSSIFEEKLKALGNNFSADVLILSKHYPIAEAAQKAFDNNRATIEAFLSEARIDGAKNYNRVLTDGLGKIEYIPIGDDLVGIYRHIAVGLAVRKANLVTIQTVIPAPSLANPTPKENKQMSETIEQRLDDIALISFNGDWATLYDAKTILLQLLNAARIDENKMYVHAIETAGLHEPDVIGIKTFKNRIAQLTPKEKL